MYDKTDLRSTLAGSPAGAAPVDRLYDAEYGLFYRDPPVEEDARGKSWYVRGQNFVIAYSEALPGAIFERTGQADEYMVLLPDEDTPAIAAAGDQTERSGGYALFVMPPGDSRLVLEKGGRVVRIFSAQSPDLVAKCPNADAYADRHANIPPFRPWPEPPDGYRVRRYSLDVPVEGGRFGRIWRCTTIMLNIPNRQKGPRDLTRVSPHHHDDFEQCSLALEGEWRHHMRWPWAVDMNKWHDDVHARVDSPSVTVIPAQVIHTSTWHSDVNQLVDIFAPPRLDFSLKPGWVLNESDYPMPAQ
ncbi:hypothetical protein K7W03_13990 [Sphingobium sp. PNB]|uniref:hypothetical protein n=1 Tax=Sphingobium sp. PNB TaxID=863934 RepID=UPI001CA46378|nr:hypothetical protein [Sphingobium sp. PNB]MCB4860701.1 hypothetical protein [Sphingobium sp. PNB]